MLSHLGLDEKHSFSQPPTCPAAIPKRTAQSFSASWSPCALAHSMACIRTLWTLLFHCFQELVNMS